MSKETKDLNKKYVAQLVGTFHHHFGPNIPATIWHYTSFETFKKILCSNELWFTHVSSLNDSSEVVYAANLSRGILDAYVNDVNRTTRERHLLETAKAGLLERNHDSTWFVACFSEADDDLSQWRAYGDSGTGVAVGFDSRELIRFFSNSNEDRPMFCQVCYDGEKVLDFFSKLVAFTLANYRDDFSTVVNDAQASEQFLDIWGKHVDAFSIVPKHLSFASEKEWRFARQLLSDRPEHGTASERRHLHMCRGSQSDSKSELLPITAVRVGPTSRHDLAEVAAQSLHDAGHHNVLVSRSIIPLKSV